jgi:hypothetical protein
MGAQVLVAPVQARAVAAFARNRPATGGGPATRRLRTDYRAKPPRRGLRGSGRDEAAAVSLSRIPAGVARVRSRTPAGSAAARCWATGSARPHQILGGMAI